jgi:hypothetical protein
MQQDLQQLKLLSIFFYLWGCLACLGAVVGAISCVVAGGSMMSSLSSSDDQSQALGPVMIGIGIFVLVAGLIYGILAILAGGKFKKHLGGYAFCLLVSIITCISSFPIGTALGIFAIVVLMRASVKELFKGQALPGTPAAAAIPPVS